MTVSRTTGTLTFLTNLMLVAAPPKHGGTQAAMNLCPSGYVGDPVKECTSSENSPQDDNGRLLQVFEAFYKAIYA